MRILSVVAVAAFVVAGFAQAADDKGLTPLAGPAEAQDMQIGTRAQVYGKITSMHSVEMVGTNDPHCLVKLESAPGDVEIVDLGSSADLKANGIEPKEGQQLWIDGRVGKINDKALVIALNISETKIVSISRKAALVEESTKHADARGADANATPVTSTEPKDPKAPKVLSADGSQSTRTVEGTVVHTRKVKIEGEAEEHTFVKVKTENGLVVLDLGTAALPANVDIAEGKNIAASGIVGNVNGKPIILAESVGNMSAIQIPAQAATK